MFLRQQIRFVSARAAPIGQRAFGQAVDELIHQRVLAVAHFVGRSADDELAAIEQHHSIGDAERAVHLVGHHDAGHAELAVQIDDQLIDLGAGDRIEPGAGLVVKQHFRIQRNRPRQPGALLHAAGQLRGHLVGVLAQADQLELDLDHDLDRLFGQIGMLAQRQSDVVGHGHRVEQRAALKQHADRLAIFVRFFGGICVRRFPRPTMSPPSGLMLPIISRSSVDFPDPEPPRITSVSPS